MTRRRKITLTALITAGIVIIASSAAAAALVLRDDPATQQQPAAFEPATTPRPAPSLHDYGREACQQLFTSDVLDLPTVTDAMEREDHDAVNEWVQDLNQAARRAVTAEQQPVRDAAADVRAIIEDGQLGDLLAMPEPPLLAFALACTEADLVEQRLIDKWTDTLAG